MVLDELAGFLAVVELAFDEHPAGPEVAISVAVRRVLERAQAHPLLHAIVSATHGADTELLPLITTQSEGLLDAAKDVLRGRLAPSVDGIDAHDLDAIVDAVVRVVLSHVMRPSGTPLRTGEDIGRLSGVLLRRRACARRRRSRLLLRRWARSEPARPASPSPTRARGNASRGSTRMSVYAPTM
jgi:hypothetical protein